MGASATRMEEASASEPTTPSTTASTSTVTSGELLPSNQNSPFSDDPSFPSVKHKRLAYEIPRDDQGITLLDMPEEVLMEIIMNLDADSLSKCYRVCKHINAFMTSSSAIALRHTLAANSLKLNPYVLQARPDMPHQIPKSSVELLAQLRERLTRFQNLSPSSEQEVQFREAEGRLYEYLEGVLLRSPVDLTMRGLLGSTYSRDLAVYDFRKPDEWEEMTVDGSVHDEDVDEVVEETATSDHDGIRHHHKEAFVIHELAVDPGQDLLLLTTSTSANRGGFHVYQMEIHLLSLTTYRPHPRAAVPVLQFAPLPGHRAFNMEFQICDDALLVLRKQTRWDDIPELPDQLVGWHWPSGRQCLRLDMASRKEMLSFVLLSPTALVAPSMREVEGATRADVTFTHHLDLYAFPPFSALPAGSRDVWRPTCVRTLDLPPFTTDLRHNILPPVPSLRADPPPRASFPRFPLHAPPPFVPEPASGVVLVSVRQQILIDPNNFDDDDTVHFMFVFPKPALLRHLPALDDDEVRARLARNVLRGGRPALDDAALAALWDGADGAGGPRRVPWAELAPYVRALGPEHPQAEWVCYVYQNRYVTVEHVLWSPEEDDSDSADGQALIPHLCLYDFDGRRVQKEINDRLALLASEGRLTGDRAADLAAVEGDWDGIELRLAPDAHERALPLEEALTCGEKLPYLITRKECADESTPLIDAERILLVSKPDPMIEGMAFEDNHGNIQIMNF